MGADAPPEKPVSTDIETGWLPALGFWLLAIGLSAICYRNPGTPDVADFLTWAARLSQNGPLAGYGAIADYPPLGPFMLWAAIGAGKLVHLPAFTSLKLAIDASQLVCALIIQWRLKSWAAASLFLLLISPFGALLGYIDVFYLPFVLLGIFALESDRLAAGALAFAIASLIKWQPTILCPVVFIFAVSRATAPPFTARQALWPLPALLFVAAVLAAFGPGAVWSGFSGATGDRLFSGQAFNLDWIETYVLEWLQVGGAHFAQGGTITFITNLPPPWYGLSRALFWLAYLGNLVMFTLHKKTPQSLWLALLAAESIQFTFNTGVHENHAFLILVLAFLAASRGGLPKFHLMLAASLAIANILAFYGLGTVIGRAASAGTVILSVLQLCLCLVFIGAAAAICRRNGRAHFAAWRPT